MLCQSVSGTISGPVTFACVLRVLACASATLAGGQAGAGVVSASNIAENWSLSTFRGDVGFTDNAQFQNTARAQYFMAGVGGAVDSITTIVRQGPGFDAAVPLRVSIHLASDTGNGFVPGARLGTEVAVNGATIGATSQTVAIDFASAGVSLEAGRGYHVVFHVTSPAPGNGRYSFVYLTPTALNFGQTANFSPNAGQTWNAPNRAIAEEIGLRVEVVPAPGTALLATLARLVACRRRRA